MKIQYDVITPNLATIISKLAKTTSKLATVL